MKHMLKNVVFLGAALTSGIAAADWDNDIGPVVGIDYKLSHAKAEKNFKDFAPKSYSGASFYLGSRFSENFGVEFGYDWLGKKTRTVTAANGAKTVTKIRLPQWRLDLNGYLPVGCEGLDLIGSVGIGFTRFQANSQSYNAAGALVAAETAKKTKAHWRLGVGAQYMLTCNIGTRALYRLEGLSRIKDKVNGVSTKYFKDASCFNLGLFYKF